MAETGTNNMVDIPAVKTIFSSFSYWIISRIHLLQLPQWLPIKKKHFPDQEKHISKSIDICSPWTPCSFIEVSVALILFFFF